VATAVGHQDSQLLLAHLASPRKKRPLLSRHTGHQLCLDKSKTHIQKEDCPHNFIVTESILNEAKNLIKHIKTNILKIRSRQQIYGIAFLIIQKRQRYVLLGQLNFRQTSH
jgi:hypothetical protein